MSPRRSSRARTTQPASAAVPHSNVASSNSSSRDRTRPSLQPDGQAPSASPAPSTDRDSETVETAEHNERLTRQTRRGPTTDRDAEAIDEQMAEDNDGDEDEEEVTRCVCRRAEYPGPPVPLKDIATISTEGLADDAGGLFIQCDVCKVWQHGGCVGIMDEAMSPDNYYCEQCRPDLHRVLTGARGQRYSRYLPVVEPGLAISPRRPPSARRDTETRSSREAETKSTSSRQQISNSRHQRITNNSRAAYEEEQMFLKALEASKVNSSGNGSGAGQRSIKRGRDDSEESAQDMKRRKTGSRSESPSRGEQDHGDDDSDNDTSRNGGNKKARGVAAQAQREREARDHEKERDRARAEAAGRRKGRAERRHADESEPPEDTGKAIAPQGRKDSKPSRVTTIKAATSTTTTTTITAAPASTVGTIKKTMRPKRGRVGRNQYTRDRDGDPRESPPAPRDSDGAGNGESWGALLANGSKPARPRYINPNRTSMNELRKRAAGILEFISRTQVEIAGDHTPSGGSSTPIASSGPKPGAAKISSSNGTSKLSIELGEEAGPGPEGDAGDTAEATSGSSAVDEGVFKEMSSLQMMDVLTREIVLWQKQHGKWGERL